MFLRLLSFGILSTLMLSGTSPLEAGERVNSFGTNPGNLAMYRYVPSPLPSNAPLVVLLHGCTQNANAFETETGWAELAQRMGFALVSAEQNSGNNATGCFNWFESGDIARGQGEALSIKQMVDKMKADYAIDSNRVYVMGFSAGAAMTSALLATYPDVFAGGAISAGVPYGCGTGLSDAFSCMSPGKDLTPSTWAARVTVASNHTGPWPQVSIWHGDGDYTVNVANATELMEQWTAVHGIDQVPDVEDTVKGYPHKVYKDALGNSLVETYLLPGMGHTVPVDPGTDEDQGGTTGSYSQDRDIWAAYHMALFFGLDSSDREAPVVTLTAPANGATVSGNVTISATASDNVGVSAVKFFVDGQLVLTDTTAPYGFTWQAGNAVNGAHTLTANAIDAAGNVGTSETIGITVSGGLEDITPPTVSLTFPTDGDTVGGTLQITAAANDDSGVTRVEFYLDNLSIGTGTPSGNAGPWSLAFNTTALEDGTHTLEVRAYDAAENEGRDGPIQITVNQNVAALDESFSDLDGNGDSLNADQGGWSGTFNAAAQDHTGGPGSGGSIVGVASSGIGCATGTKTQKAAINIDLGDNPQLVYYRKLDLSAAVNFSTTAHFRIYADGTVVDEKAVTYETYQESDWTRQEVDLSPFADQTVLLEFEVAAYSNICLEVRAEVLLDDLEVTNPTRAEDSEPPSVNLSAPTNGALISGVLDLEASATDNVGVVKVEFYGNGQLLGVDTTSPYQLTWDSKGVDDGDLDLAVYAYDAAGNRGTDNDTTVTINQSGGGTSTTTTFSNNSISDGYVKAFADGSSPAIGSAVMEQYYGLALGRGTDGKFNRVLLSFDTSSLPNNAQITSATLEVEQNSLSGDPWADPAGNELVVDVSTGCLGNCATETGDWAAQVDAPATAKILKWNGGPQTSTNFDAAGLGAINTSGETQLKLRFKDNPSGTNYVFIKNGATAKLTVTYQ